MFTIHYYDLHPIQGVPKLFVQINTGDREHEKIYFVKVHMVPDGNF